jgi:3-deoxy-D-manno-octulosonic-acid transferase
MIYRALTRMSGPAAKLYLWSRVKRGKEDRKRLKERFGHAGQTRPHGLLVWIHAASVGESVSVLPVIGRLQQTHPKITILMTTGTVTSAKIMAERLPDGVIHQFVPVDLPGAVARFLNHWQPDLALWMESEFWPNLIVATAESGVPMILLNASLSRRSFKSWQRLPTLAKIIMTAFRACLAQSEDVAKRLKILGATNVICAGNLKYAAQPLPAEPEAVRTLEDAFEGRPRWLAASTHAGEEEAAGLAHKILHPRFPNLLTIIAPRHPERGAAIAKQLGELGLSVSRRSGGQLITPSTDIYLADTLGELGVLYKSTAVTFMGGSLVPHGGHNPLEPARLDCAILHGPYNFNFEEPISELLAAGASKSVSDASELAAALAVLLESPEIAHARAAAAKSVGTAAGDILDQVAEEIGRHFPSDNT